MRQLSNLLLAMVVLISASSFRTDNKGKEPVNDQTKIEVVFTRQLGFDDLAKIKADLAKRGVAVNFGKLQFDGNNKLTAIDFSIDIKDFGGGSASTPELTDQHRFGFIVDYSKEAGVPFQIGSLDFPKTR